MSETERLLPLLAALERDVARLREAVVQATGEPPTGPDPLLTGAADTVPPPFADGLWIGVSRDAAFELELRFDCKGTSRVSGDLFRRRQGGRSWCAAFALAPTERVLPGSSRWRVFVVSASERRLAEPSGTAGLALLAYGGEEKLLATLRTDGPVPDLPTGTVLVFELSHASICLRRLRAVEGGAVDVFSEPAAQLKAALGKAGIELAAERSGEIPASDGGWAEAALLDQGLRLAAGAEHRPDLVLLWPDRPARDRVTSLRLPGHSALPVSVVANFVGTPSMASDHAALRGVVSLLGLDVRRGSILESLGRKLSGVDEVATDRGTVSQPLSAHELAFLRHAPLPLLGQLGLALAFGWPVTRPGAYDIDWLPAPYGGATYDEEWPAAPRPDVRPPVSHGLRLEIDLPQAGRVLALGQPLFLAVRVRNGTQAAVPLDPHLLDPKRGVLMIRVRRLGWSRTQVLPRLFRPAVRRIDPGPTAMATLAPGAESAWVNLQLGYGLDGHIFAEPGTYELLLQLDLPAPEGIVAVAAPPCRIRVGEPIGHEADDDALALLEPAAGFWLALGGARSLAEVGSDLLARADYRAARGNADGVVAAIWRGAGIDMGRRYIGLGAAELKARALSSVELLGKLSGRLLDYFDPVTAEETVKLRERRAKLAKGHRKPRRKAASGSANASRLTRGHPR